MESGDDARSKIRLQKFDIAKIRDNHSVLVIGKRATGKSTIVKDILYQHRDLPVGVINSCTENIIPFYRGSVPPAFITEEDSTIVAKNLVRRQRLIMQKSMKPQEGHHYGPSIDTRAFLVLDNCFLNSNWIRDEYIRTVFMNGRCYHIMLILTLSYALEIPPSLRTNLDFVFILREGNASARHRLYKRYANNFPTFEMFSQVMDQYTNEFECLVIHYGACSNRLEDQVFWYKAPLHDDFKLGAAQYWELP